MSDTFEIQIDRFVADTEKKLLAVTQSAIQSVVDESQTSIFKGGKIPVDTGFLRASGVAEINQIPTGLGRGRHRKKGETGVLPEYASFGESVPPSLARLKIGDFFVFGWTAKYARLMEIKYGFLESALQNWQSHVDAAVKRLKK